MSRKNDVKRKGRKETEVPDEEESETEVFWTN